MFEQKSSFAPNMFEKGLALHQNVWTNSLELCTTKVLPRNQNGWKKVLLCIWKNWKKVLLWNVLTKVFASLQSPKMVEQKSCFASKIFEQKSCFITKEFEQKSFASNTKCLNKNLPSHRTCWNKQLAGHQKFDQKSCFASKMIQQKSCFAPKMFEQKLCKMFFWTKAFLYTTKGNKNILHLHP